MDDLVERLRGSFDYDPGAMQDAMLEAADRLILYREALVEFCDRVERGEIRSTKTYNKFKTLLGNAVLSRSGG